MPAYDRFRPEFLLKHFPIAATVVVATIAFAPVTPAFAQTFRTVILSGQQIPGLPAGITFSGGDTLWPMIDQSGNVAFSASLSGGGGWAILQDSAGTISKLVGYGDPEPGVAGATFSSVPQFWFYGSNGKIAFPDTYPTPSGVWTTRTGSLQLLLQAPPYKIPATGVQTINGLGQTAVAARNGTAAIVSDRSGSLQPVVSYGDPIPGVAGATFDVVDPPLLTDQGKIVFAGGPSLGPGAGIYSDRSGALQPIVQFGSSQVSGLTIRTYAGLAANTSAQVAFGADFNGGSSGIVSEGGGSLHLVARQGDHAPGTPVGTTFRAVPLSGTAISANGTTVFGADVDEPGVGGNPQGIWKESGGVLQKVAFQGDPAPGAPAGATFNSLDIPVVNSHGQVAFFGDYNGEAKSPGGVWEEDRSGQLQLVVRVGQQVQVAPGDIRTISSLELAQGPPYHPYGSFLNDKGQVSFFAQFTDSTSGVFVSPITPSFLKGDVDQNGVVNVADVSALMAALRDLNFYKSNNGLTVDTVKAVADINNSTNVDNADIQTLIVQLASSGAPALAQAVPEPSALALGIIAAALVYLGPQWLVGRTYRHVRTYDNDGYAWPQRRNDAKSSIKKDLGLSVRSAQSFLFSGIVVGIPGDQMWRTNQKS
jgi:hypothetical protein